MLGGSSPWDLSSYGFRLPINKFSASRAHTTFPFTIQIIQSNSSLLNSVWLRSYFVPHSIERFCTSEPNCVRGCHSWLWLRFFTQIPFPVSVEGSSAVAPSVSDTNFIIFVVWYRMKRSNMKYSKLFLFH